MKTWSQTSPEVIIIGSGPGSACSAAELSKMGKKVLVLEWGSSSEVRGTKLQSIGYALIPGRSLYFTPELLALVRFITLGGSSIGYYATAFDPSFEFFDMYGIDLRSETKLLHDELPIAPIADNLVGPSATRIMAAARQLGYPWEKLNKIIYQYKCRTGCDKCTMGCPYGAKWTSREYVDQAISHGAVCLDGA